MKDESNINRKKSSEKIICSPEMRAYFNSLEEGAQHCYDIASQARSKGFDPELTPEIIETEDLAARVEGLVGPESIAERIRNVANDIDNREVLSLTIAKEIATDPKFGDRQQRVDQAIRTGLAILTEGVLVAPIEGIANIQLEKNPDGTEFIAIYYAGPIRSAGGTGQAMSVLIADIVRRELGLSEFKPIEGEIERFKEEIPLYKRKQRLQYTPTSDEIDLVVRNCPICIDGEGTEEVEVSGYRNIARIKTSRLRGGACLVIAEGLCLKASKIYKHVQKLDIKGWEFIERFANKGKAPEQNEVKEKVKDMIEEDYQIAKKELLNEEKEMLDLESELEDETEDIDLDEIEVEEDTEEQIEPEVEVKVSPSVKYMRDSLAGRPIFSHPSAIGGFRLRYGNGRTTGLAAVAIHPATMNILDKFLTIGTQMKIERPGKAGAITPCDSIEGPIVLLKNGDLVSVNTIEDSESYLPEIEKIIDIGEILIPFGEFAENNHPLVPPSYTPEWWELEYRTAAGEQFEEKLCSSLNVNDQPLPATELFKISEKFNIPLHPYYNLFWHDISILNLHELTEYLHKHGKFENEILKIPYDKNIKDILVTLGALHREDNGNLIIDRYSYPLIRCCGLDENFNVLRTTTEQYEIMSAVKDLSGISVRRKSPTRIGASMGRPEKAKERKMKPPVHVLFPLGQAGGSQRLVKVATSKGSITVEVGKRKCSRCGEINILPKCSKCGNHTEEQKIHAVSKGNLKNVNLEPLKQKIKMREYVSEALANLNESKIPDNLKGVIGLISKNKTPEPLEKGILRTKNGVFVFKDGTTRFDMTDVPITHFKPSEVLGVTIEKLIELGYTRDYKNSPLENEDQVLELKPQDLIVSKNCGEYLLKITKFLDELLVKYYKMEPYYNSKEVEDVIGHLVLGLSPHTSCGILGRIIGYIDANVGYAHPFFHAAKRRNCDGDEDCVMLLVDGLLNFSRSYLPSSRGGYMDAPLVLMKFINPNEIDKEAHNVDVGEGYPLEFYQAAEKYEHPKKVEPIIETVGKRIGTEGQYEGFKFCHDTTNVGTGPNKTMYKTMEKMIDKMEAQLKLAERIRAVDESNVAAKVIQSHFLPDMIGNLNSFSRQKMRCTKCNGKHRRVPLSGICNRTRPNGEICGGNLILTVHEGGVRKYLEISKDISERYNVPTYTKQRILLLEGSINSLFQSDRVKKCKLDDFM
jgi:DNA polymerase II large subunit